VSAREVDLCVIGAGSGGLSVAAVAAQLGARTVLVERGRMGGDCLNYGCVPSKSLLAAAKAAEAARHAGAFGVVLPPPAVDFAAAMRHVKGVIAAIEPNDSEARFTGLGVEVIRAEARFVGAQEIEAGATRFRARRIVVATGSSPAAPPIPGLAETPYLTNETVFGNETLPGHLLVIGGGPIGLEMAQAHRRLGARVTVLEAAQILAKDDPEPVALLRLRLRAEGIAIREEARIARIERAGDGVAAVLEDGERIEATHLLVAAGRRPNVAGLGLENAGILYSPKGIEVDARLRTSNRKVYAIGDVAGGPQFTHVAGYHAGIVIRNALFRLPAKVDYRALPRVTYTAPELAQAGLTEAAAREQAGDRLTILRWPLHENDRAQAERMTGGLVKIVASRRGKVLGASILAPNAGELIQLWCLAIQEGIGVKAVAGMIAPYPTFGEASKRAAATFFVPTLFSGRTKKLVRFLAKFG
jgi:pyruvate/2-oxoglutarate dehydrogenase complex dihydrolipoamide dehydrogenase (E3) component